MHQPRSTLQGATELRCVHDMVHDPRFTTHGQRNRHCLQSRYIVSVRCGSRACFCISVASHDFTARRDGRAESPARKAVDIRSTSAHTLYTAAYANSKSNCIRLYTSKFLLLYVDRDTQNPHAKCRDWRDTKQARARYGRRPHAHANDDERRRSVGTRNTRAMPPTFNRTRSVLSG